MNDPASWLVFGRIAGEHLPSQATKIGSVNIGPLPPDQVMVNRRPEITATPRSSLNATWRSSDVHVSSHCYFWAPVVVNSSSDALELFAARELPLLQATLSMRYPQPYHVELLWAQRREIRESAPSPVVGCVFWAPSELRPEGIARADIDYAALDDNQISRHAARDFSDAIVQGVTTATQSGRAAALLTLFQVIERMTRSVPMPSNPDLERDQRKAVDTLKAALASSSETDAKSSAIKAASDELRRLEYDFLNLRVMAMADTLGLGEEWRKATGAFIRFKNRRAGHGGPPPSIEEIQPWIEQKSRTSAYALAATL